MNEFLEDLDSLMSPEAHKRQVAEQKIRNLQTGETSTFISYLYQVLLLDNSPQVNKQLSIILLRNTVKTQNDQNQYLWYSVEESIREKIKECILASSGLKSHIEKQSCKLLAVIFSIEILQGRWMDLIGNLIEKSQSEGEYDRNVAVILLCNICQNLNAESAACVDNNQKQQILKIIINNVSPQQQKNIDIQIYCLETLGESDLAMLNILENCEEIREQGISQIFAAIQSKDVTLQKTSISNVSGFFSSFKAHAQPHIEKLILIYNQMISDLTNPIQEEDFEQKAEEKDEELVITLFQSYLALLKDVLAPNNKTFQKYSHAFIDIIQISCEESRNPSIEYICGCLNLLINIGNHFKEQVYDLIKTPFTYGLLKQLMKCGEDYDDYHQEVIGLAKLYLGVK